MSQLQNLKQQIVALGRSTQKTAQGLAQFDRSFSQQTSQIQATIGGSAQSKDRQMINAINDAKRKVHEATAALAQVSKLANQYSSSL